MQKLYTTDFLKANAASERPAEIDLSAVIPSFGTSYAPTADTAKYLKQIQGTAWAALKLRSSKVAALQWKVYRRNTQSDLSELGMEHYLVRLLDQPNRFRTRFEIWSYIDQWLTVTGNCFLLVLKDQHGDPAELWPLDSHRVAVIPAKPDSGDLIAGYYYFAPTQTHIFGADEIIHLREPIISDNFLRNLFYGVAEFSRFTDAIDTEMSTLLYQSRYFRNNAMPNFVIERTESGAINQANVDLMRQQWEQNRAGAQNAGKFAILPFGFTFKGVQGKNEIDYLGTMKALKERICESMGVPPPMLTADFANGAQSETVVRMFMQNCITPRATLIKESLTNYFSLRDAGLVIDHEPIVHDDPDVVVKKVESLAKLGGATLNELRNLYFGWDEIEGGDDPLVPNNLVPLSMIVSGATLPQPAAPPTKETPNETDEAATEDAADAGKSFRAHTEPEEKLYAVWKAKDNLVAPHTKAIKKSVARVFGELRKEVVGKLTTKAKKDAGDLKDAVTFDVDEWTDKLTEGMEPSMAELVKDAVRAALVDIDFEGTLSTEDALRRQVIDNALSKIRDNSPLQTISDDLGDIVEEGLSNGKTPEEIAKDITEHFDFVENAQAQRVAQTTATGTMNNAQTRTWQDSKLKIARVWLSQRDGNVRPAHVKADGQQEDRNGVFHVGGEQAAYPGDAGLSAGNMVNCRCYIKAKRLQ